MYIQCNKHVKCVTDIFNKCRDGVCIVNILEKNLECTKTTTLCKYMFCSHVIECNGGVNIYFFKCH